MAEERALILKSSRYQDASKIVSYFSFESGLRTGFARGATARDNRFGASLEPLTLCRISGRIGSSQSLHRIHHADILDSYRRIHADFNRLTWAGLAVRFLLGLLPPDHPEPSLFDRTVEMFGELDAGSVHSGLIWILFARESLAILGYRTAPARCARCHKKTQEEGVLFYPGDGTVLCRGCRKDGEGKGIETSAKILDWLSGEDPERALDPHYVGAMISFLDDLISHHHPRWIPTGAIAFLPE